MLGYIAFPDYWDWWLPLLIGSLWASAGGAIAAVVGSIQHARGRWAWHCHVAALTGWCALSFALACGLVAQMIERRFEWVLLAVAAALTCIPLALCANALWSRRAYVPGMDEEGHRHVSRRLWRPLQYAYGLCACLVAFLFWYLM